MTKKSVILLGYSHTYYEAIAEKPVASIIALHGFGLSGRTFRHIAALLNQHHISIYAIDLLGFGNSDKPPSGYALKLYAELIAAFKTHLALEKPILMGHSFGGLVALATAVLHQDLFGQLILLAPGGFHPFSRLNLWADNKWAFKLMNRRFFKNTIRFTPLKEVFPNAESYAALLRFYGSHHPLDLDVSGLRAKLASLSLPILMLWGKEDHILPAFVQRRARTQLPAAHFQIIQKARHAVYYDQPKDTAQAIISFLARSADQ